MDVGEYIRNKNKKKAEANRRSGGTEENLTAEQAVNRYSSMNEEQLMQELFKVGSVSSGNVSAGELDEFFNKVKGYITPEQAAKMKSLIMQLKMQ